MVSPCVRELDPLLRHEDVHLKNIQSDVLYPFFPEQTDRGRVCWYNALHSEKATGKNKGNTLIKTAVMEYFATMFTRSSPDVARSAYQGQSTERARKRPQ